MFALYTLGLPLYTDSDDESVAPGLANPGQDRGQPGRSWATSDMDAAASQDQASVLQSLLMAGSPTRSPGRYPGNIRQAQAPRHAVGGRDVVDVPVGTLLLPYEGSMPDDEPCLALLCTWSGYLPKLPLPPQVVTAGQVRSRNGSFSKIGNWSFGEIVYMLVGIEEYGAGNWAVISREVFAGAVPAQRIRAKFRNMYEAGCICSCYDFRNPAHMHTVCKDSLKILREKVDIWIGANQ